MTSISTMRSAAGSRHAPHTAPRIVAHLQPLQRRAPPLRSAVERRDRFVGSRKAGSDGSTSTCVTSVTTGRATPARPSSFWAPAGSCSRRRPANRHRNTSSGIGGMRSAIASLRSTMFADDRPVAVGEHDAHAARHLLDHLRHRRTRQLALLGDRSRAIVWNDRVAPRATTHSSARPIRTPLPKEPGAFRAAVPQNSRSCRLSSSTP